jgi:hypothetical protein
MDPFNSLPQNITVGALGANGQRASYSTAGSAIWVSAPGGEFGLDTNFIAFSNDAPAMMTTDQSGCSQGYVRSSVANPRNAFQDARSSTHAENLDCNYTSTFNGTSSAAPGLSGAIALILEANPSLTWRDVKHILASTSTQVDASIAPLSVALGDGNYIAEPAYTTNAAGFAFHNWYGFGRVDVSAAVSMAKTMTPDNFGTFTETAYASSGTINLAIPDNSTAGAVNLITDSNGLVIEAIKLRVIALHTFSGDLGVELTSPSGTRSVLFTIRNGFSGSDDLNFELLSNAFYGENSAGVWTIKVVDGAALDTGTLTSWGLQIYGH